MPELPEVETVKLTLAPLIGATIAKQWWSGKALRLGIPPKSRAMARITKDAKVAGVRRLGKYLLLDLAAREMSLLVHLGMSGRLRLFDKGEARGKHTHFQWALKDGRLLHYCDPRRFGQVDLVPFGNERAHPALTKLGPDPIAEVFDGTMLREGLMRTARPIKVALLDQHIVAGVGNIYASEALHRSGIHPMTPAKTIGPKRADRLALAIVEVLQDALSHGGTSLRDFVAADGHAGEHSHYLHVYDRDKVPCPKLECPGRIRRIVQQGRASYFCPRCQHR